VIEMGKKGYLVAAIFTGILCITLSLASAWGYLPFWLSGAVISIAFPFFAITLYLWWTLSEKEGDIPFIGY